MQSKFFFIIIFIAIKAGAQSSALSIADSLYTVGKYAEAIDELNEVKDKSEVVYLKLAAAYEAKGLDVDAAKAYEAVLEKDSTRTLAAFAYGKLLTKMGSLEKADSTLNVLVKKFPKNSVFAYQYGLVKEKKKDSTAMSFFARAAMLDKANRQAHFKVAKNRLQAGKFYEAKYMSERGLEANPNDPSLLSILAQTEYHLGNYKNAVTQFQKLVEMGEGSEFIHRNLGAALSHLDKIPEAIQEYLRALEYNEENPVYHHNLGKLYTLTGDLKAAKTHLLQSILLQRQPLDEEFFDFAMAYKASEDYKRALDYLEKALQENQEHEKATFQRAIIADSFYEDLKTRRNFYQAYLNKFGETGDKNLILLAKRRVTDLSEEIHLSE